jgi:hypothetical protein
MADGEKGFHFHLRAADWDAAIGGWRCDVLRYATAKSVTLEGTTATPVVQGGVLRWPSPRTEPADAMAYMTLDESKKPAPDGGRWKVISGILALVIPVVGIAIKGYFDIEIERLKTQNAENLEASKKKCADEVDQINTCVGNGSSLVDCKRATFNIGAGD